ncbi:hypothetical protein PF008_g6980 [Phytophthora fragariae]|uniref:Uncharacterized protein n=1 Tax=Phytophthora fragariae TaxID=53985 RepID=A0A6G0S445_9STRA|nr:hypothetical protein PF008_g6980 [Phytophthora fragariae]
MTTSQQRAQRFQWEAESNGKMPRAMLTKWLGSNYDEYFRSSNLAEVVERFRQELRVAGFHGCTIDEIQTEITSLIRRHADIKTETGFQDGSVHAPLAVYDEALFDARLKFGRKKTLSQVEIDLYFPKPET